MSYIYSGIIGGQIIRPKALPIVEPVYAGFDYEYWQIKLKETKGKARRKIRRILRKLRGEK